MSNILNSEDFGLKIYNRFPPKYREDDVGQKLALKRYLQALSDGGFRYIIQDTNGLLDIKDPSRTSLDILLNLYKQYGLEVFNGIPENYLRSLLPYLSSAWKYKGSIDIIEFVTTTLSGIKVSSEINYADSRTALFGDAVLGHALFNNKNSHETSIITVRLEMDFSLSDYFPSSEQFRRILENFVPFYCDLALVYSYVYSDENAIIFRDFNIDHITDTKTESRNISRLGIVGSNTEVHKDKIGTVVKDSINIHTTMGSARFNDQTAKFSDFLLGFVPFEQTVKVAYTDSKSMTFIESAESVISTMSEQNATFGHAVMTRARFNDKSFEKTTVSY